MCYDTGLESGLLKCAYWQKKLTNLHNNTTVGKLHLQTFIHGPMFGPRYFPKFDGTVSGQLDYVLVHIDDVCIVFHKDKAENDHLSKIEEVLSLLEERDFCANLQKSFFYDGRNWLPWINSYQGWYQTTTKEDQISTTNCTLKVKNRSQVILGYGEFLPGSVAVLLTYTSTYHKDLSSQEK